MPGFADIVGHEQIIQHLKNAVSMKKISHAYIFDGPERSGKMMLAEAFAEALLCERNAHTEPSETGSGVISSIGEGCHQCRSCKQALNKNHPDILYVTHEKPNTIAVSDIRQQLNGTIDVKPYNAESQYKIYIVDEAEKMNEQAQNALLKTLEEPPAYAVILLLTTNADSFLQTIRSRCVTLELTAVADEKIHRHLMRKYQVVDYKAEVCVAFAQGNVGRAIMLAGSQDFNELKDATIKLVRRIAEIELSDVMGEVKAIEEFDQANDFFDLLMLWYRDVLIAKATSGQGKLIYKDQAHEIAKQAENSSYEGLNNIIEAIENARRRIRANVNMDMTLELLLLNIKNYLA